MPDTPLVSIASNSASTFGTNSPVITSRQKPTNIISKSVMARLRLSFVTSASFGIFPFQLSKFLREDGCYLVGMRKGLWFRSSLAHTSRYLRQFFCQPLGLQVRIAFQNLKGFMSTNRRQFQY